jgi:transposase
VDPFYRTDRRPRQASVKAVSCCGAVKSTPSAFDAQMHERRNVVECSFNRLKQWRGIAMRSDKTARNYHAGITLAAALIWLRTT